MRHVLRWIPVFLLSFAPAIACDDSVAAEHRSVQAGQGSHTPAAPPGQLLVLRLGDSVEVVSRRSLRRAPKTGLRVPRAWTGRWSVVGESGREIAVGRFRLPRWRHALFGAVGGPAQGVRVPLTRPVVLLRVPMSSGARRLVLYDDHGRTRLGEVSL